MDRPPLHARPWLPSLLAFGALILAAIGSLAGLLIGDLYRDTEAWIREARATDLVTLVLAVPILALALWRSGGAAPAWRLVAAGALWYLAYSYAIFAFSVAPNPLTLLYIATLGLAAWSLVLGMWRIEEPSPLKYMTARLPGRLTGAYLVAVPILFGMLWLGEITSAGATEGPSDVLLELGLPTNPIWPLDLAFALPVVLYGGIRLLRGEARALVTALPALVFLLLIGFAVLGVSAFDVAAGAPLEPAPLVIVGSITLIAVVLSGLALRPDGLAVDDPAEP